MLFCTDQSVSLSREMPLFYVCMTLFQWLGPDIPTRCMWSSSTSLLAELTMRNSYGISCIPCLCPKEWDRLPLSLCSPNSLPSFKSVSKFTISPQLSRIWNTKCSSTSLLTIFTFPCDTVRVTKFISNNNKKTRRESYKSLIPNENWLWKMHII